MNGFQRLFCSSIGKKYLMALSGVILTGFVLGHMVGNLQFFGAPAKINAYAHFLHNLPDGALWIVRIVLLLAVVVHFWTGFVLYRHNRAARPGYAVNATRQASLASRTMIWTGLVVGAFIVFHILHYTVKAWYGFDDLVIPAGQEYAGSPDVHTMMFLGFSVWYVSLFYIVAVGLLMFHLSHGVASMFQSVGLRNEVWRPRLKALAWLYGAVVFAGFVAIPLYVLMVANGGPDPLHVMNPQIQAGLEHMRAYCAGTVTSL